MKKSHFDSVSMETEIDDGPILGVPQLICMITGGLLLCLLGVFITSYGVLYDEEEFSHILTAIGPTLLFLGVLLLLICLFACIFACHRNNKLPPILSGSTNNSSSENKRATFYYDNENMNSYLEKQNDMSRMDLLEGKMMVPSNNQQIFYDPINRKISRSGLNNFDIVDSHQQPNPYDQNRIKPSSLEDSEKMDAIRFLAETVATEKSKRKLSHQAVLLPNNLVHEDIYRSNSNGSQPRYEGQTCVPPHETRAIPGRMVSLHHAHSYHCIDSAHMNMGMGQGPQIMVEKDMANQGTEENVNPASLTRTGKISALNLGYGDDVTGYSASYGHRARTNSVSPAVHNMKMPHRLKRNYTVSTSKRRPKYSQNAAHRKMSNLYHQQISMPSGSFQQLNVQEYKCKNQQQMDKDELFERTCGTLKKKRKSTKNKKKDSSEGEKPVVLPLPTFTKETVEAVGLEPKENIGHPEASAMNLESNVNLDGGYNWTEESNSKNQEEILTNINQNVFTPTKNINAKEIEDKIEGIKNRIEEIKRQNMTS